MDDEAREATEVMTRYCAGEPAAFHRLYALLAPRILAYLWGLIGEKATDLSLFWAMLFTIFFAFVALATGVILGVAHLFVTHTRNAST